MKNGDKIIKHKIHLLNYMVTAIKLVFHYFSQQVRQLRRRLEALYLTSHNHASIAYLKSHFRVIAQSVMESAGKNMEVEEKTAKQMVRQLSPNSSDSFNGSDIFLFIPLIHDSFKKIT